MIIKECKGNEERKQRQANQPNTQKKTKRKESEDGEVEGKKQ